MKTKDTGKTRNRYEKSSSLASKNASREAQEEDLNAGFQGSAPIFSSRTLKSDSTELSKKSSIKRKFNFDQIFDDCDEFSIDKTASQTSTAKVKKSSSSSKSIEKRGGILLSSAISTSSIGDMETIEDIVVSKQKPTSKSKRANNLRGSRAMIEEQSIPMVRKKFDYAKYLSEGKPLSTMIVSQRAAAVNPNQTYRDPESSEDEKRSKIQVKKKKSKNQNDFEYSEEKERPDLDIFRLQSFDLPVVKRNFEGKSIDLSKFKIKSNELIGENQQRCPIGLFCDALLPKTLSPRLEKALEKYIDLKEQCSVGKVSRDAVVGARDQFCLLHQAEDSIIPIGIKKGYLIDINFSQIPSRLETYSSRFNSIISKKLDSTFLQDSLDVISSVGQAKARGADIQMQGAEKSQCGYYGITGYNWIFKFLLDKFHSLEPSLVHPLTILEFIQLVLIPEAALVLIAEDYKWNVDKEKKKTLRILASSHEFGNIIHFETNDDILYGLQQFSLA